MCTEEEKANLPSPGDQLVLLPRDILPVVGNNPPYLKGEMTVRVIELVPLGYGNMILSAWEIIAGMPVRQVGLTMTVATLEARNVHRRAHA